MHTPGHYSHPSEEYFCVCVRVRLRCSLSLSLSVDEDVGTKEMSIIDAKRYVRTKPNAMGRCAFTAAAIVVLAFDAFVQAASELSLPEGNDFIAQGANDVDFVLRKANQGDMGTSSRFRSTSLFFLRSDRVNEEEFTFVPTQNRNTSLDLLRSTDMTMLRLIRSVRSDFFGTLRFRDTWRRSETLRYC